MLSRLKQMAQQQSAILQTRDEVIGLGTYGSLAYNRVTPFSDLDIFIITTESEHTPDTEHRLYEGIRVDFIWEPLEKWRKIQYATPSYMPWYLVKALLLGTDDLILYDPCGVIREKRDELRQEITYDRWLAPMLAEELKEVSERFMIAIWQKEEGQFLPAWREASRAFSYLSYPLCDFTVHKRIDEAAQAVEIPGLAEYTRTILDLKRIIVGITPEYVWRVYEVDKSHWEYQLESIWQPLQKHLKTQGVDDPVHLPVIGELVLCYGGERLYELGRAVMEHSFSLEWAKAELGRGDIQEAIYKIQYEDLIDMADEKWRRIDTAITDAGYDTGDIIEDFLTSEEFEERTEIAREKTKSPDGIQVTAEHAHQLFTTVYEYSRLLSEYWVSHYPESFEAMPEVYTLSRKEIIQRCQKRETRIYNEFVYITVSKERAAIKSLVFKPGTNTELIEIDWCNAYLLELSSILQRDLTWKWALEKEEVGTNEAHFIFSQNGGYRVDLDIMWSKTEITVTSFFQLPQPIAINNNIAVGGKMWPKPQNDFWATTIDSKVEVGNYDYKLGPHVFIYPSDGSYFIPEGCWIAAWNEDTDEVCGFTFSPNCGCIVARGASTDFEFYLPAGESMLRFHVIKPKPTPPYLALQKWACSEKPTPLALNDDSKKPLSPYTIQ